MTLKSRTKVGKEVERETGEGTDLWRLVTAPTVWATHFLACYVVAAIYCEKLGRGADLEPIRWTVVALTLIALLIIGLIFRSLWKVRGLSTVENDLNFVGNSPEERHRFLSHLSLMLCVLSLIGVIYVAIPVLWQGTCR